MIAWRTINIAAGGAWLGRAPAAGCTKVSAACDRCYAGTWTHRFHKAEWGNHARIRSSVATWRAPIARNKQAAREGQRFRVFCSQLSDVFDNQAPDEWRDDLWHLIPADAEP
jgi:protein gp37